MANKKTKVKAKPKPKQSKGKKAHKLEKADLAAYVGLFAVFVFFAIYIVFLGYWQVMVLLGNPMANPDGTVDSIANPMHFAFAVMDLGIAIPIGILGIVGMALTKKWGLILTMLFSFFLFYMNAVLTAASLLGSGFDVITLEWVLTYPLGSVVGLFFWLWFFNVRGYIKTFYGI